MKQKWIIETDLDSELCIGRVRLERDNIDDQFRSFQLCPVLVWIPDIDDEDRVGGIRICERDTPVPELDTIAFDIKYLKVLDIQSEKDLYRFTIKSVLEFNQKKV